MAGALIRRDAALVVDLCRGHVPVAEQVLDFDDVHASFEEQRGRRRPQRVRRVDALAHGRAVWPLHFFHCSRERRGIRED